MKKIEESFDNWKYLDSLMEPDEMKKIRKESSSVASSLGYDVIACAVFCLDLLEDVNFHGIGADIADIMVNKLKKDGVIE
jgi:hypothetical protein